MYVSGSGSSIITAYKYLSGIEKVYLKRYENFNSNNDYISANYKSANFWFSGRYYTVFTDNGITKYII